MKAPKAFVAVVCVFVGLGLASTSWAGDDDDGSITIQRKRPGTMEEFLQRKRAPQPKPKPVAPATPPPPPVASSAAPPPPPPPPVAPPPVTSSSAPAASSGAVPMPPPPAASSAAVTPPPPAPPPPTVVAPPPPVPAPVEAAPAQPRQFDLTLFGDVEGRWGTPRTPRTNPSFGVGAVDLLFTGDLMSNVSALAEINTEFGTDNAAGLDIERVSMKWDNGAAFVEAGRVHIELGYWNVAYHHGKYLQPTLQRPTWIAFEDQGGVLPIHFVGVQGGYVLPVGRGTVKFLGGVGNGRGLFGDDVQSNRDQNRPKGLVAKIEAKGLGAEHLVFGTSGYYGRIVGRSAVERPALPDEAIDELIGNVYLAHNGNLLVITEGFVVNHAASSATWRTYGAYAVVGYHLDILTPYVLGEVRKTSGPDLDPFYARDRTKPELAVTDQTRGILGLRLETSAYSALKLEYEASKTTGEDLSHLGTVGWSFGL